MSKCITKVSAKPTTITHRRAYARCANTIFKVHIKLKIIPTYGNCGIMVPSANKTQDRAFFEELEVKSLVDGHHLI